MTSRSSSRACAASLVLVLSLLFAAGPGHARALEVIVLEDDVSRPRKVLAPRAAPDAVMIVSFAVGSVDDGIQSGLTRLSQHMLLDGNGQEERGALWRDLYAAAAELDITTDVRRSTFRLRAPRASFDGLAARLLRLLFEPKLEKRQFARCRRMTLNDEMVPGSREHLLSFLAGSLITTEGGGVPGADYTNAPYGEADVVRRLSFDDVEQHVSTKLTPANATVVVTGRFDRAKLERALSPYQGGDRRAAERADIVPYLPKSLEGRTPRELYLQAHVIALDSAEEAASARLLTAILEERMRAQLRKQGAGYELEAYVLRREWLDLFIVEVPVSAGGSADLATQLRSALGDMRDGKFRPGEFERNKRFALAEMERDDVDSGRLADNLLDSAGRVSWHSLEVRSALDNMAQAVFLGHARSWLDERHTVRATFAAGGAE